MSTSDPATEAQRAQNIANKVNAGGMVSPIDRIWAQQRYPQLFQQTSQATQNSQTYSPLGFSEASRNREAIAQMLSDPYSSFNRAPVAGGSPLSDTGSPESKARYFWTAQGKPQYQEYAEPNLPAGSKVTKVTETSAGINIEYELSSGESARLEAIGTRYLAGAIDMREMSEINRKYPEYAKSLVEARASGQRAELIGGKIAADKWVDMRDVNWLARTFPDYTKLVGEARVAPIRAADIGGRYAAGESLKTLDMRNIGWLARTQPEYTKAIVGAKASVARAKTIGGQMTVGGWVDMREVNWLARTYPEYAQWAGEAGVSTRGWAALGFPQYGGKYAVPVLAFGSKISKVTETEAGLSIEYTATGAAAEPVSAEDYFNQMYKSGITVTQYGPGGGKKTVPFTVDKLPVPEGLEGSYAEWVSSKSFWSEKGSGHYFPELGGKYAPLGEETHQAINAGWIIGKYTETPEGLSIAWKEPPKSVTQQISEFKIPSLGLGNMFMTEKQKQFGSSGASLLPQGSRYVKPLTPLTLFFAPVEQAVLGTAHLVARVVGKDNPYFAAQPPSTPFSAGVGLAFGSRAGVEELGKLEPYEVFFRGLGDVLALKPTAELAMRGAGKLAQKIEVWRYGAEGTEKWMESIRAGTIVNPETGATTYTGFAAKQASRLSQEIVSLPFGTTKSLPNILSGVSEETGMSAIDFSMDLTMTPHASAFSIAKLANPAYMRPSLPVYQMIGGALVNISDMVTPWTESEKFEFTRPKTSINQTSIQTDFEQLGFKDVISPKETPFNVQGFKPMDVGYSGSATQRLYMKASNVISEVKNMFADTGSAYRMELMLSKPSTSFMEVSIQGISAGLSAPSARLAGVSAASFAYTGAVLPLLGSYKATATEKAYVKAQNEMYGKAEAPSRITVNTKLSSVFAFPTSTGAFPIIPEITMQKQGQRFKTAQADIEDLGASTLSSLTQAGAERFFNPPAMTVPQLTKLKYRESTTYLPKALERLTTRQDLGVTPMLGLASALIPAQIFGLKEIVTPTTISMAVPKMVPHNVPWLNIPIPITGGGGIGGGPAIPPFKLPSWGGSGMGGGGRGGFGKWFKMTRPILEPKQVWRQFWGSPKLSVSRLGARGKRHKVQVTREGSRKKRSKRKK